MHATALIAEDEPLLAQALLNELQRLWPQLQVLATTGNGEAAVDQALSLRPDVCFFDIRMPGKNGVEAAQALAEDWPDEAPGIAPFPLIVFVTAYEQYAVQAFEAAAVDYVLKPVEPGRLAQTCTRLQSLLVRRSSAGGSVEAAVEQLRSLLQAPGVARPAAAPLQVIQASVGQAIHMVPLADVVYFEAADKYVRVLTAQREYLIRTSLRELLPQLDAQQFWQVHRSVVVRAGAIETAVRDEAGKLHLTLRERPERLGVSRMYAHLFKAM
ncbi:LytTR family DNA-binding domain-containing protein [Schlegelella sp. S2-27]|uniref:LytTR family DNA-binding domain-containing protein n=1 Tax=Caldimonas mangrovi TaxID=2944811 RepID=A0ABT0YIB0_9BURK|nr:LytTR family DNA-binding domain-containing protein [Caldimonas mangrovi]MCM5678164.1 LytTR family DNA-binding domain-containing protein [Caldimonas mangrovi]